MRSVVVAPAERYIVEVRFDQPGSFAMVNAVQAINHYLGEFSPEVDTLGSITVVAAAAAPDYAPQFATLRVNTAVSRDIEPYRKYFDRAPDKTIIRSVPSRG